MAKDWIDFKAVKERADFRVVLDHYGRKLKAKGQELTGVCPFHRDTRPSFRVNLEKQVFHCFGCGAKGNILDFVSRKEGTTIQSAARLVAEWCGIAAQEGDTKIAAPRDKRAPRGSQGPSRVATKTEKPESRPEVAEESVELKPLPFTLKLDPEHPYLAERGLSPETAQTFGLGYCSQGLMKGRIAIPIHDKKGNLVAYAGRWPGDEIPEGEPKYKLPEGFKKSRVLFNFHRVLGAPEVVIVEGFFSVFWLHQLGIPAVALMGRTLSARQEELLVYLYAGGTSRLTLLLDGDEPGRQAAASLLQWLVRRFFVRLGELPDGAQPDTIPEEDLKRLLTFHSWLSGRHPCYGFAESAVWGRSALDSLDVTP